MANESAKVVEVRTMNTGGADGVSLDQAVKMLETGLDELSPTGVGFDLLEQLFPVRQTIGIKVNALAGREMSTSPPVVFGLTSIFSKLGHKKKSIIIWDRREQELRRAGYTIHTRGSDYLCFATDTEGVGFSRQLYSHKSIGSLVSRIQAEISESVVNFPVLKDHSIAGLAGCLKNYYGAVHNPNKYHGNHCDPYQADLFSMPMIRDKQKLAICDAVRVQYNGGPGYVSRWATDYGAILLATDAVALDRVATEIIDRLRTRNGLPTLKDSGREAVGIQTAGAAGLGSAELTQIRWVVIEI